MIAKKKKVVRAVAKVATPAEFKQRERERDAAEAVAIKAALSQHLAEAMKANDMSRNALAFRMDVTRSQIARLLDPKDGKVTLTTLQRAARLVGRSLRLELI